MEKSSSSKITMAMCILMEAGCGLKKVSVLVATVESMERVSREIPGVSEGASKRGGHHAQGHPC